MLRPATTGCSWLRHVRATPIRSVISQNQRTPTVDRVRCFATPAVPTDTADDKKAESKGSTRITAASGGRNNTLEAKGAKMGNVAILKQLFKYVWPRDDGVVPNVTGVKVRVLASVGLLVASKVVLIQVPYFFKDLIDTMGAIDVPANASEMGVMVASVPVACVLGYGMSRAMATIFHEMRNGIFSVVSLQAVTALGQQVFEHLHSLDLGFHLNRETGAVTRIMQRGTNALNWILTSLTFNVIPTLFEVALVNAILTYQFGWEFAAVSNATLLAYIGFTAAITEWRTQFLREKNRLENQSSSFATESLMNYETVKYFGKEQDESQRYVDILKGIQNVSSAPPPLLLEP